MPATGGTQGAIVCFPRGAGVHWLLAGVGVPLALLFCILSTRLIFAGGELRNLEVQGKTSCQKVRNFLSWRGDSRNRLPYQHLLSSRSNVHETATVAIKFTVVLANTFLGSKVPASPSPMCDTSSCGTRVPVCPISPRMAHRHSSFTCVCFFRMCRG